MTPDPAREPSHAQPDDDLGSASLSPFQSARARIAISDEVREALEELASRYGVDPQRMEGIYKDHAAFTEMLKGAHDAPTILRDIEIGLRQGPIGPRS